ncbi:hypothetical protein LSAT2_029451, partial [Lamellibrachia satsuma]
TILFMVYTTDVPRGATVLFMVYTTDVPRGATVLFMVYSTDVSRGATVLFMVYITDVPRGATARTSCTLSSCIFLFHDSNTYTIAELQWSLYVGQKNSIFSHLSEDQH